MDIILTTIEVFFWGTLAFGLMHGVYMVLKIWGACK